MGTLATYLPRASTLVSLSTAILLALTGCSDNTIYGVWPPAGGNLISNESFEYKNAPTLDGWTVVIDDTAYVNFVNDVPPGGGMYSVALRNVWTFPGTIRYSLPPVPGRDRYRLAVWGKAVRTGGLFAGGWMSVHTTKNGVDTLHRYLHFSDSVWTYGQFDVTIPAGTADSIIVQLQGNPDQWSSGYILFDLCSLETIP